MTATLRKAASSRIGLTQQSIIEAHRSIHYHANVMRPGVDAKMDGVKDDVLIQSLQIIKYDAKAKKIVEVGSLITNFEKLNSP